MNKKLFLLLTLASVTSAIQAKPYQITAEDKACTSKAEGYGELTDCFNDIGNKADSHTLAQLKAKNMNLYKQYDKEADRANKQCRKKYLVDDSLFSRAEKAQCYMDKMLELGEKYDKIVNHKR